jgi:hypothetical protein
LPTGESGGRGAFPTPITVAYIIMVTEFLNNNKYFSTGNVHRGRAPLLVVSLVY